MYIRSHIGPQLIQHCLIEDCMQALTERPESRAVHSSTTKQFSFNVSNTNFDENGERLACSRNNNSQNTLIHCSVREPGSQLGLHPICLLNSSKNRAIRRFSVFCFFSPSVSSNAVEELFTFKHSLIILT